MKIIITTLLLLSLLNVSAQHKKPFFDNISFSGIIGNQQYMIERTAWKNMYANRPQIPYQLDSLDLGLYALPKDGLFYINVQGAGSLMLGKMLIDKKAGWWHNKVLEWRTGFYFKSINYGGVRDGVYTNFWFPVDTTKTTVQKNVRLNQQKKILEWQNLVNFKTGAFLKNKLRFIIGSGLGISHTLKNTITEQFDQTFYIWNPIIHSFNSQSGPQTETNFKAKPETHFSYIFYLGTELKISSQISFISDFQYTLAHNKYSTINPKSEGYWLGLTFCYAFNL